MNTERLIACKKCPVTDDYIIEKQLGVGKFSVVNLVKSRESGEEFAAKIIDRSLYSKEELENEISIMQEISEYPHVIHLKSFYETNDNFVLIMELVRGGELFDKIVEYEFYSEKEASKLIFQIVKIVDYLHKKGIVHRDLKPENLLFEDKTAKTLKVCDFGLAERINADQLLDSIVGSPTYMAPEILEGDGYGKAVDMYSIGVILYILLCGYPPFEPEEGIVDLEFPSPEWDLIPESVRALISNLLNKDPAKRLTASEMCNHEWVRGKSNSERVLDQTISTLMTYNRVRRNPGMTMRCKDVATKATIFNIFNTINAPADVNKPSSVAGDKNSENLKNSSQLSIATSTEAKSKKSQKSQKKKKDNNINLNNSSSSSSGDTKKSQKSKESSLNSSNKNTGFISSDYSLLSSSSSSSSSLSSSNNNNNNNNSQSVSKFKDMYNKEKMKCSKIQDKIGNLEVKYKENEDKIKKLKSKVKNIKNEILNINANIKDLESSNKDLIIKKNYMEDDLRVTLCGLADSQKALKRSQDRMNLLDSAETRLIKEYEELVNLKNSESKMTESDDDDGANKVEIKRLQDQLNDLKKEGEKILKEKI